jgi:hypothetical protein
MLQQGAGVFQEQDGTMERIDAGPVQTVVVVWGIVEAEVECRRLIVDQGVDVILHQFCLVRPHPLGQAAQSFHEQEDGGQAPDQPHRRFDGRPPTAANQRHQAVHGGTCQIHRRHRQDPLQDQQHHPGHGPATRGRPHEGDSPGQIPQLSQEDFEVRGSPCPETQCRDPVKLIKSDESVDEQPRTFPRRAAAGMIQ